MGGERFSYKVTKDGRVFVYWHGGRSGREIVLKGTRAARLIAELPGMDYEREQLALARATGNFKRGNERRAGRFLQLGCGEIYRPWPICRG
ncbi:MAG: hypothetical protein ACRDTR_10790 [Rubrobacter sp.]